MIVEQNAERLVLVTGATGRQGGAVAQAPWTGLQGTSTYP